MQIPHLLPKPNGSRCHEQEALERARESQDLAQSQRQIGGQVPGKMDVVEEMSPI